MYKFEKVRVVENMRKIDPPADAKSLGPARASLYNLCEPLFCHSLELGTVRARCSMFAMISHGGKLRRGQRVEEQIRGEEAGGVYVHAPKADVKSNRGEGRSLMSPLGQAAQQGIVQKSAERAACRRRIQISR